MHWLFWFLVRTIGSGLPFSSSIVTSLLKAGMYSLALETDKRFHSWMGSWLLPKMGSFGGVVMVGMRGRAAMVLALVPVGV